jgi:Tol biopolymer transport system component
MTFVTRLALWASTVAVALASVATDTPPASQADPFKTRTVDVAYESASPDGTLVAYRQDDARGRLVVRTRSTGAERALLDAEGTVDSFAWSPDSRRMALTYTAQRHAAIRIVTLATGESRTLTVSGSVMAWTSKDEILFSRRLAGIGTSWYRIPAAGGEPRVVLSQSAGLEGAAVGATLPDGASLIVSQGRRLLLYHAATGAQETLTADAEDESAPVISPDGRLIAFASSRNGDDALYVAPLDQVPIRHPLRIASLDGIPAEAVRWWTTDGLLAFRATYDETNIYRVNLDPRTGRRVGAPRRLAQAAAYQELPIVSPDGQRIAFLSSDRKGQGIATIASNGGGERRVLTQFPNAPEATPVAWRSPDAMLIRESDATGNRFAALHISTGARETLPQAEVSGAFFRPTYVPLRQEVLYASSRTSNVKGTVLTARSLVTGQERVVATIDYLAGLAVSADGRHIAYSCRTAAPGPTVGGEMRLMTIDGVPEKTVLTTARGTALLGSWSPDGKFLLYFDENDVPRVMNVGTTESWLLLDADDQTDWSNDDGTWSPDASFIVLSGTATRQESQMRAWEGVTYEAVKRRLAGAGK